MLMKNYNIISTIYESRTSLIYRARKKQNDQAVILKGLKSEHPSVEELARFRREYDITRTFNANGIIKAYGLFPHQHTLIMVLEDFGGDSLANILKCRRLTLKEFLNLAIGLADSLAVVHAQQVMHKDINPSNIIWNSQSRQLKLIDFGISTSLSREQPAIARSGLLEGTLAYISPEQTGRINRPIDYRTDLYSLGVTLYEMLCGRLPFDCNDVLEWVHAHIAKTPAPPHELVEIYDEDEAQRALLGLLSEIILTLMAKTVEERYQSASGLRADLQRCLACLQRPTTVTAFELKQHDFPDRLQIPQKLYGREHEIQTIMRAFNSIGEAAVSLSPRMVLVRGQAGSGKTSLIAEIRRTIVEKQTYFISGKFDQLNRNTPYSAIIAAFQELIRQILSESEIQVARWKKILLGAIGQNGRVLIEMIPEVEHIIGKQAELPVLPPKETQNRFIYTVQQFMRVFAVAEHPLVIFLDDLQWADDSSLNLLESWMSVQGLRHMLILGAYRDDEIDNAHHLAFTLNNLRNAGASVHIIRLSPLSQGHVSQLLTDSLKCEGADTSSLAEICFQKTKGNPFFLGQLLISLHDANFLSLDRQRGCWKWDIEQVRQAPISENVVLLMTTRLQALATNTLEFLKLAACIGNQFDLHTLALVHETTALEAVQILWPALKAGFILPLDNSYQDADWQGRETVVASNPDCQTPNLNFQFLHDRLQQAAYDLNGPDLRQKFHLKIGRLLLTNISDARHEEHIFDIVYHLNICRTLLYDQTERIRLAKLNLIAGKRAKASAAYQSAFEYLQTGLELLDEKSWQQYYDLTLSLYEETAEAAYLNGNFDEMERLVESVLQHARRALDYVKIHEVKIRAYNAQDKLSEAVGAGLQLLKLFGINLPQKPNKLYFLCGWLETKVTLSKKRIEDLANLPKMKDPYKLAGMRILMSIGSVAFNSTPELLPLVIFKGVKLLVKYGNPPWAAFAYGGYGLILCGVLGDIESGYRFGKIALDLQKSCNVKEFEAKVIFIVSAFITHWKEDFHKSLRSLYHAYQTGLETGDIEYAGYAALHYFNGSIFTGKELCQLEQAITLFSNVTTQLNQKTFFYDVQVYLHFLFNLTGKTEERYDKEKILATFYKTHYKYGIWSVYHFELISSYLFQKYSQALENVTIAETHLDAVTAMFDIPVFHFYNSLIHLAIYPDISVLEQKRFLKKVAANQRKMKQWAHHAPMNHLHKWHLVEAERARVLGNVLNAIEHYDKAIELAKKHEYINEEALANELAARFYLVQGKNTIARMYMQEARYCYTRWGALAKVKQLEQLYPDFFKASEQALPEIQTSMYPATTHTVTVQSLDLKTIMKAAQAISRDLDHDKLVKTLLETLIENTGAQKGVLVLVAHRDRLLVNAAIMVDIGFRKLEPPVPLDEYREVSKGIIRYVARTQQSVVLDDASRKNELIGDNYILSQSPKSLLCTPIVYQNSLTGILYLEHGETPDLFTPERQQMVIALCSQVAISIEHARIYRKLEKQEEARRRYEAVNAANQAKSEFLRTISHEIRNPLNAIILGISNLDRQFDDPETRHKYLKRIDASSKILQTLVNSVLDLSSIEAGQFTTHVTRFDLHEVVTTAVEPFRFELKQGVELTVHLEADVPLCLYGDGMRLMQILANLVSNAVKFTPDGKIVVTVCPVSEKESRQQVKAETMSADRVWLHFVVQDTGPGISEEEQCYIFDPYFQGKEAKNLKTSGTGGIGMTIVKKIVNAMGGEISIQSRPGRGTQIHLILPFTPGEQCAVTEQKKSPETLLPLALRVLVVEDNHSSRFMMSDWLTSVGCQVTAVENGDAAIESWQRKPFDVILMDKQMPGMDGLQATRKIRSLEQDSGERIPIIALTASASTEDRTQCLEAGMDDYLPKPVELGTLLQKLNEILPKQNNVVQCVAEAGVLGEDVYEADFPLSLDQIPESWRTDPAKKKQYVRFLIDDICQSFDRLEQAIQDGNSEAFSRAAHKLKGAVGKIRSVQIREHAAELEKLRRQGDLQEASLIMTKLKKEVKRFLGKWMQ